jgi:hypothetical protein
MTGRCEMDEFCKEYEPSFTAFMIRTKINNERKKWHDVARKRLSALGL